MIPAIRFATLCILLARLIGACHAQQYVRRELKSRTLMTVYAPGSQFKWMKAKQVAKTTYKYADKSKPVKACSKYCAKKVSQEYLLGNVFTPPGSKSYTCYCLTTKNDCNWYYKDMGVQNENVWYAYRGDGVVMVDKDYEEPYIHEGCTEPV